jgi:hypothetical protein
MMGKTVERGDTYCCRVGRKVLGLAGQGEGSWRCSVVIYTWNNLLPGFCLGVVHLELLQTEDKDWVSQELTRGRDHSSDC